MNQITNNTNKNIIAENYTICNSIFSKAMGLMFSLKPRPLVFVFENERKVSIHMLFVFFSIDLIYLDSNKKVVEIKQNLKPFCFYYPQNKAKYVVELPVDTVSKTNIKKGDNLTIPDC